MTLKAVRLELGRTPEFPYGSPDHGYEFVVPLDAEDHLDVEAWSADKKACTVRGDGKPVEHRGWGQPDRCPGRTSPLSRMGPHPKQTIRASGSRHRANRPDTRLNPTNLHQRQINPCNQGAIHTGHNGKPNSRLHAPGFG